MDAAPKTIPLSGWYRLPVHCILQPRDRIWTGKGWLGMSLCAIDGTTRVKRGEAVIRILPYVHCYPHEARRLVMANQRRTLALCAA